MGFTGSRATPFVGEPLSETRVPDIGVCPTPPRSPAPACQGWEGARLVSTPAERAEVRKEGRLRPPGLLPAASRATLRWGRRGGTETGSIPSG